MPENKPWFRFYNRVVNDPKLQKLPPALFKSWVNFMCIASENASRRGTLPDIDDVSFTLRVTRQRAEAMLNELVAAKLFDWVDGVACAHDWDDWQFQSDVSTSRVKRYRDAQRNAKGNVSRNVPETPDETGQSRAEEESPKSPPPLAADLVANYSADFEAFWSEYPRKVGKEKAYTAWRKRRFSRGMQEAILQAVRAAKKSADWLKDRGEFIPGPATWLNQGRWNDELTSTKTASVHDYL